MLDAMARDGGRRGAAALRVLPDGQVADPIGEADQAAPAGRVSVTSRFTEQNSQQGSLPNHDFLLRREFRDLIRRPIPLPEQG